MTVLVWVGAAIITFALLWNVYQLIGHPRDLPLRAVVATVACFVMEFVLGSQPVVALMSRSLPPGYLVLVENLFTTGGCYSLMCFFLLSAATGGTRRIRREGVALAAVLVAMTLLVVIPNVNGDGFGMGNPRDSWSAGFFLLAGLYLVYALAVSSRWAVRYARIAHTRLRHGLIVMAVGLGLTAAGSAGRAVTTVLNWAGGKAPAPLSLVLVLMVAVGIIIFLVGVCYPGTATRLVAARLWLRHMADYHRLGPLWTKLHLAYPEYALERIPRRRWDLVDPRAVHGRYYRRVIECRDGLVRISPYLAQSREADPTLDLAAPSVLAAQLQLALDAHAAGRPVGTSALAVARPETEDLNDDVRQLVALSTAVGKLGPDQLSTEGASQ
ncbi:MAB_1171c family putative transporter [Kutzneria sp. NPDC052558]|uniref:MAB_1171c family putative transporter n=1 Tax=Kutzneria sp. NPDC052558 TaxID=3364121 RepID=UPI0037C9FEB3